MSEYSDKPLESSRRAPTANPATTAVGVGHAGGGPVLRTRLPRTTAQIALAGKAAPNPQPDVAAQPNGDSPTDAGDEGEPAEAVAAAPSAPPPPAEDPFGLHLLPATTGDGIGLPTGLRSDLESATGASLSGVTIRAGAGGAQKADAHGARAVAEGKDIAFAAGEYRPDEPEGKKLIAHEVAHTVQQDLGPTEIAAKRGAEFGNDRSAADADADDFAVRFAEQGSSTRWRPRATAAGPLLAPRDERTIDRDRRHFTEATRGDTPVNAAAYLQSFYKSLLHGIGQFLLTRKITTGHPDLQFIEGPRDFLAKLGQLLDVGDGRDVVVRLAGCVVPGNLYEITDRARPITDDGRSGATWVAELSGQPLPDDGDAYNDGPRGPRIWQPAVAIAVGSALEAALVEVMPQIAAQYIAVADRKRQLANERGEMPEEVKATELIPGHPLAWYVARAFAEPPASVEPTGGKLAADPEAMVAYKKVKEVRWLGPPAPWNAVQPVKPAKTSREAMAARFLGSPTEAHRIEQVGDYYLLPEEVAATIPEAARNRPRARKEDPPADAVHALATSTAGDQAAVAEADVAGAKAPQAGELITLWAAIDKKLQGLVLATAQLPGQGLIVGAAARHTLSRLGLEALGAEEATTRGVIYRSQLDLLTEIAADVGALAMHIDHQAATDPWADRVSAGQKTRLTALLRAASLSHLPDTGRAALDEARTLEQTQVLDTLDALFSDAVARVEAARQVKDDAQTQSKRGVEVFGATLPQRRDLIRQEMADLRTKLRQGTAPPEAIQRLVTKVDGFRFEAMLVANYGAIQQVMHAAEQLEESDWVAAVGKIDNLEDIRGAGNRFRMGLSKILGRWLQANQDAKARLAWIESKGGDPDLEANAHALVDTTLAELRAKLVALGDDEGIQQFLRHAYEEIDDAQTKAAILQVATVIGVTIVAAVVSAGVGSVVGGAAAGLIGEGLIASGIGILAESATMSVATTLLNGGDFGEVFVSDMAQNVAMMTALKGFDAVFRATRLGQAVGRGAAGGKLGYYTAKGVELTGRSLVMAGMMAAGAEVESLRKQGRTLTAAEMQEQGVQGIAQVIGTAVLARLAKTPMAQLKALGTRGGALVKQHAELMMLARRVKKTKVPADALKLLQAERAHLEAELTLWQELSTKTPAELHRMGVEREVVEAMVGSTTKHLGGLDQLEGGTLPAQLGLETVVPGKVYEGPRGQVAKVLDSYRKPGVKIETHAQGDGGYRYRVVGTDGSPVELIARPEAAAGIRSSGAGASRRAAAGASAAEAVAHQPAPARPEEQVRADVERASLRAANMAGGVKVEDGGSMRLIDGGEGFVVRVEVADLGANAPGSKLALADDHAVLTVSTRARADEVERVIAHRLTEAVALTARRRAGKPLDIADVLGKGATGETLSPADMGKVAELRVMRRQFDEARTEGPAGAERAERLANEIQAYEQRLAILDDSAGGKQRRRMVEMQVVVQNDRARRDRARVELDGDRGHPGIEVHSHFMGVVDTEVFRSKAAKATTGEDTGSWVPVLEQLATLGQFEHGRGPDGAITKRSTAGDAFDIVNKASEQVDALTIQLGDVRHPEAKQAIQERIEMIAEDAVRAALTATERTDFNSAYEMRDELVKGTFAGERPKPTGNKDADKAAATEYEARAYDEYTREAIRRLARDRVGYTEQSNSAKKLAQRFGAERIRRIIDELIVAGEIKPGEVDVRFLTMIPTRNFGERADGNPEEAHAARKTDAEGERAFGESIDTMGKQVRSRADTVGMDIASLELYEFDGIGRERFKRMYDELRDAARERGQPTVLRPHVGEGAVDNDAGRPFARDDARKRTPDGALTYQERARHNLDQFLTALEELRDAGDLDPTLVVVRFGHATMATPEQVARMKAVGVIAEVNLGSNVRTGSVDQTVGNA